jgi:hypothetical protein
MRFREFKLFFEDDAADKNGLASLKQKVITGVKQTDDLGVLEKIYTTLEGTNLQQRIRRALRSDGEARNYVDQIVKIILDTPGTVEEKLTFSDAFPEGYVNIDLMLSGKRVYFEDLIQSKVKGVSNSFAKRVFVALKALPAKEKGPGEFSLAVLSPRIDIFGAGDLKIDDKIIEVKASGGRLGSTGFLNHAAAPEIIQKYMPIQQGETLGLKSFNSMANKLEPAQRKALANELFPSLFKPHPHVDLKPLINALERGDNIVDEYILASYRAYIGPQGKEKFSGIMLMNFETEELRYFTDPVEMVKDIDGPQVAIISSNQQFAPRNIIPALKLKREKAEKVDLPKPGSVPTDQMDEIAWNHANYIVRSKGMRDRNLIDSVYEFIAQQYMSGIENPRAINQAILQQFPELRKAAPQPAPAVQPQAPVQRPAV